MKLRARNKVDATFNMSSMTDIVFLLLIFFIVLSTFVTVHGLDIDLPKVAAQKNAVHTEITVEMSKTGEYMVNGEQTTLPGLLLTLQEQAAGKQSPSLVFFADTKAEFGKAMEVIAEAKALGYDKIVVRTEPK